MREINQLIFNTIKDDPSFKADTGATASDPRIYKSRTPKKNPVTASKPAYAVYTFTGASKPPNFIENVQRNDCVYTVEAYSKTDTGITDLADTIEDLFNDKAFTTPSFKVGYTYAVRGIESHDEGRNLYTTTITIHFSHIYEL